MNSVNVTAPIKQVQISYLQSREGDFKKVLPGLYAGDIVVLSDTSSNSLYNDGLYIVNYKDEINNGISMIKLKEKTRSIHKSGFLATSDIVDGKATVMGHLDIIA